MRRRARNVYGRPVFLAKIGGVAFAVTMLTFVALAHAAPRGSGNDAVAPAITDSLALIASERAGAKLAAAEAALAAGRAQRRMIAMRSDTMSRDTRARRDSLVAVFAELTRLLKLSERAPLVPSYRALGTSPSLAKAPHVAQLVDSLSNLDKARSDLGSSDGADPIFVALTARVGAIGHQIEAIARTRRSAIRRGIDSLTLAPVSGAAIDTIPLAARRDSAARLYAAATHRVANIRLSDSLARARKQRATAGWTGVGIATLVLAAAVIALVTALAIALTIELRWPHVADVAEAEALSGARVLVTVGRQRSQPERQRRAADREVPPMIEQSSDAYRLLYGQLADATFDLTVIAVVGDDPYVTVTVAANLAAIAARGGRATLLLDTDFRVQPLATMTGVAASPGVADVLAQRVTWAGATTSVLVSRGRSIDVLPSGGLSGTLQAVSEEFAAEVQRLGRRYETVVLSASTPGQGTISVAAAAVREVVICLRLGRSTHASLRGVQAALESSGAVVRGLVLWDAEDPAVPPESAANRSSKLKLLD